MYILVIVMKNLKSYMTYGIVFVAVLGTLFHFLYELSGNNFIIGLFTPVNESIWEHTKLIFFPMLLYWFYLSKKIGKSYPCVKSAMKAGTLSSVVLIIVLFYTYSGIIGYNVSFIDISIFYISVIISFYIAYKLTLSCKANNYNILLNITIIAMIFLYFIFTFYPPNIPLFITP